MRILVCGLKRGHLPVIYPRKNLATSRGFYGLRQPSRVAACLEAEAASLLHLIGNMRST